MTTQTNAVPETVLDARSVASTPVTTTRPFYWSVKREMWENHSIFVAPVAVAGVILVGFLIAVFRVLGTMREVLLDPTHQSLAIHLPYDISAALIIITGSITGAFYCLDALYGERRDRSVLFWKSMPVSDVTSVLAKASIPLVVLPLVVFVVTVATHIVVFVLGIAILPGKGFTASTLLAHLPLFRMWIGLFYSLIAISMWLAPIYSWLLLVSAWARRGTFLWAVLPPFAIMVLEKVAFNTSYFAYYLRYRLLGWYVLAYLPQPENTVAANPLSIITPGKFFSTPGVWLGLLVAALFLAIAVRLRRCQGPV
jgi:ABC-2 type transport system permease protein